MTWVQKINLDKAKFEKRLKESIWRRLELRQGKDEIEIQFLVGGA